MRVRLGGFFDFFEALLAGAGVAEVFATGFHLADQFDFVDDWGEHRVDAFDADAICDFAHSHGAGHIGAMDIDDDAFKNLDAFLFFALGIEFLDFLVDADLHA